MLSVDRAHWELSQIRQERNPTKCCERQHSPDSIDHWILFLFLQRINIFQNLVFMVKVGKCCSNFLRTHKDPFVYTSPRGSRKFCDVSFNSQEVTVKIREIQVWNPLSEGCNSASFMSPTRNPKPSGEKNVLDKTDLDITTLFYWPLLEYWKKLSTITCSWGSLENVAPFSHSVLCFGTRKKKEFLGMLITWHIGWLNGL